jgi:hypothetical protein
MKFTGILYNLNYQEINAFHEKVGLQYRGFHQTLCHFRQQKGPVCGNRLL